MSSSYSILNSNVVFGAVNVPQYSFVTAQNGVLQLECLDPSVTTPTFQVDGVVECDTVALTSLPQEQILATDASGGLSGTGVTRTQFQSHAPRLGNLEAQTANIGTWPVNTWQISNLDAANRVYYANGGPTILRSGDGTFTMQKPDGANVLHITSDGNVIVEHIVGDGRYLSNVASSNASFLDQGTVDTTLLPGNIVITDNYYGNAVYANLGGEYLYGNVEGDFVIEGGNLHAELAIVGGNLSLDLPLQLPDGTVQTPALSFTTDLDTGLVRAANNTIGFVTGGNITAILDGSGVFTASSIDPTALPTATTSVQGIVQLDDTLVSNALTTAPTSNALATVAAQLANVLARLDALEAA